MAEAKRVAIYARISKDLTLQGLGVERQLTDCRKYADEHGHRVVEELVDNDISASGLKKRPSYLRLKELMEARVVDIVLVYSMDRLHRSMKELVEYIDLSRKTEIGIASCTGSSINLATAEGRFQAHIFGAVAAAEREKTQERIKRKMVDLAEKGQWPGRRAYGYTASGEIVEAEAEVIRELCERVLLGHGLNEISADLERREIHTLQATTWRASTIRTICKSARIAGHREHHGVVVARNAWAAIIDQETHALMRARFAPGQSEGTKRGGPRKHLLTGLFQCGICGRPMVRAVNGARKIPSYRCAKNQGTVNCGRISIVLETAEAFVAESLFEAHDKASDEAPESSEASIAQWTEARDRLEDRKQQLARAFAEGVLEMKEWMTAKKSIDEQLATLPTPIVSPIRQQATGAELREAWPHLTSQQKRSYLDETFEKIVIMPRLITSGQKVFDPRRFEFHWRI